MVRKKKQARRPDVPDPDHVARYCNAQRIERDLNTKEIIAVLPQAFELRPHLNEKYLSVHWMESFGDDVDTQFKLVNAVLRKKLTLAKLGAIARVSVKCIKTVGVKKSYSIRIRDRSDPTKNPGYASIENIPLDNSDLELLELIATQCCVEVKGIADI